MHIIRAFVLTFVLGAGLILTGPTANAQVAVGISVDFAPPPLPIYDQPVIPGPGYLWVPGYWAWSDDIGYYWVPGTWILPPVAGLLWTPGYWAWNDGAYVFYDGYWGPEIGFYGGVNYGFGYTGDGYEGGYWSNGSFFYNTTVNNVSNVSITNVYNKTVVVNNTSNVSYNGGTGGTAARPTPEQLAIGRQGHIAATPEQRRHVQAAAKDPALSLAHNHGHPTVAATVHPAQFRGPGVVAARPGKPVAAPKRVAPSHALPGFTPERNVKPLRPKGAPSSVKGKGKPAPAAGSKAQQTVRPLTPGARYAPSPVIRGSRGPAAKPLIPQRTKPVVPSPHIAPPAPMRRPPPPPARTFTPQTMRPAAPPAPHFAAPPPMRRPSPPPARAFMPQTMRPAAPPAPHFAAPPPMRRPLPPANPRCPPGKPCR